MKLEPDICPTVQNPKILNWKWFKPTTSRRSSHSWSWNQENWLNDEWNEGLSTKRVLNDLFKYLLLLDQQSKTHRPTTSCTSSHSGGWKQKRFGSFAWKTTETMVLSTKSHKIVETNANYDFRESKITSSKCFLSVPQSKTQRCWIENALNQS